MANTHVLRINGEMYFVDPVQNEVRAASGPVRRYSLPRLKPQEIPFDHPHSVNQFRNDGRKPFLVTPGAKELYGDIVICGCLTMLQALVTEHGGLDYFQVFLDDTKPEPLWFLEDGDGGAVTAMVPSEH